MRVLYITLLVVLGDQLTKLMIKGFSIPFLGIYNQGMELNSTIEIIGDFARLTFVENPGMVFGIDIGGNILLSVIRMIAGAGILYYLYKVRKESLLLRIPLALILGGAIGNLIDRMLYGVLYGSAPLFYGKVVDFIDIEFFRLEFLGLLTSRWPVFNIADAAVTVGVVVIILFHKKISSSLERFKERILFVPTPELKESKLPIMK